MVAMVHGKLYSDLYSVPLSCYMKEIEKVRSGI